jgi:hypothetical protein
VRLAWSWRNGYWADYSELNDFSSGGQPYVLRQKVHEPGRLDLSASYTFLDRFTVFTDWTNILSKPQKVDLVRMDPTGARFDPQTSDVVSFAWRARYQERILSLGVRFRFGGGEPRPAAVPAPPLPPPPPPPPAAAPEPPPPPPPPAPAPERG